MDGWIARQGEEGGRREENWIEVKESKMRTRNELVAVGGRMSGGSNETSLIFFLPPVNLSTVIILDAHTRRGKAPAAGWWGSTETAPSYRCHVIKPCFIRFSF